MDIELIVRTTAVLLGAGAIVALLRRAAPSTRHLVWHIAIVAVLLAPILVPLAPKITIPGVPNVPSVPGIPRVEFQNVPPAQDAAFASQVGLRQGRRVGGFRQTKRAI